MHEGFASLAQRLLARPSGGRRRLGATRGLHHVLLARVVLTTLACSLPAVGLAQPTTGGAAPADPASGPEFFPRFDFHLTAEHLSSPDRRFVWDTNFGGELDVVRVRQTRLTFVANYQAMLGEELRPFDPNQGNYILAGSITTRLAGFEVGPVFYHQSRHLSDRTKRLPVDWNMFGGRVARHQAAGRGAWDARADLRRVVQKSYVDYVWELDAELRGRVDLGPRVALVGGGGLRHLGVDGSRQRAGQTGGRADGGVRFEGTAGAIELFVAAERRIDPYQLAFGTAHWVSVGMRLLGR
jgi:hypothetical protein